MFEIVFSLLTLFVIFKMYKRYLEVTRKKNYCTCFFEGDWSDCCYRHDEDCLMAIEYLSSTMRYVADIKLKHCVEKKGHPIIARIMYCGVRAWAHTFWWVGYWWEKNHG